MRALLVQYWNVLAALGVLAFSVALGLLVRRTVLRRLESLAGKTSWKTDDALVASIKRPLPLWFALAGAYAASRFVAIPQHMIGVVDTLLAAMLIGSLTLWAADLSVRALLLHTWGPDNQVAPMTGVVQNVVRIGVFAIGVLVLLSTMGISVAPVLTTVGIGGIAVALGLQDTLANLFAGVHITLAGNIRVGDFVRLESGEEGYVEDIRWRSTRIRTLPNNFVLIPNSRLAQSTVTNYHLPSKDLAVLVQVGVHYASDLDQVERVTIEVAREVMRTVEGAVREFEPFIRYHTFGASSIDLTVILRANEFAGSFLVKHEFVKALARRYAAEGIVIPFPISAVNFDQEGAARALEHRS